MSKLIRDYQLDNYYNDDNIVCMRKRKRVRKSKDPDEQDSNPIKKD